MESQIAMNVNNAEAQSKGFYKLSWMQRIGFGSGDLAQNLIYQTISMYLLFFYTNVYGLDPGVAAIMFLIVRIVDVIWTLTLQTTLKYVIVALRADNNGEGGIMALFSLVKKSIKSRWTFIVAAIGASALLADGIITPAMTVTSAVEGLRSLYAPTPVIPIVLVIITLIFFVQRSGTSKIGKFFGPAMLVWFLMLGVLGIDRKSTRLNSSHQD